MMPILTKSSFGKHHATPGGGLDNQLKILKNAGPNQAYILRHARRKAKAEAIEVA